MTRATPWKSLDECIATLTLRRNALDSQISDLIALRDRTDDRDIWLLLTYLVTGSKAGAADLANGQGWRAVGKSGGDRRYRDTDIDALLKSPPIGFGSDLISPGWPLQTPPLLATQIPPGRNAAIVALNPG